MEEGREWKLCDKPFSHPLYFRGQQPSPLLEDAVWSERACTFSAAALSLQKFSPWTVCLQAVQHWLYCTNQSLEAEVWNTQLKQELCLSLWGDGFLCSRLSSSGSDFNSAQRLTTTTKKRCTCVSVSITEVSNAPLPHLPLEAEVGLSFTQLWEVGVRLWFVALFLCSSSPPSHLDNSFHLSSRHSWEAAWGFPAWTGTDGVTWGWEEGGREGTHRCPDSFGYRQVQYTCVTIRGKFGYFWTYIVSHTPLRECASFKGQRCRITFYPSDSRCTEHFRYRRADSPMQL